MSPKFPWPVTRDEVLLETTLSEVITTLEVAGHLANASTRISAAEYIVDAYIEGVRDSETLAVYALSQLRAHGNDL